MLKYFLAIPLLILQHIPVVGQDLNYREIFGDDWLKAEAFEQENRHWMSPILKENNIPYHVALSVIFPELVRYSAFRDKMETTLLKTLYVNLGDEYADFSVGPFQIKPTFAEFIRTESSKIPAVEGIRFSLPLEFDNISDYRKSIVADLERPQQGFTYLVVFMKLCEVKFKTDTLDEEASIKFLASAYNTGIDHTYDEIIRISESNYFTTSLIGSEKYSYPEISLYWYRMNIDENIIAH